MHISGELTNFVHRMEELLDEYNNDLGGGGSKK
jgi:hypothetical protein